MVRPAATARDALALAAGDVPVAVVVGVRSARGAIWVDLVDELAVCAPGTPVVVVGPSELADDVSARGAERVGWKGAARGKLWDALERSASPERRRAAAADVAVLLGALPAAAGDGVVVLSMSGRVLDVNAAGAALLGRSPDDLRFEMLAGALAGWRDATGTPYEPDELPPAVALRTGEAVPATPCLVPAPDGGELVVECVVTPVARAGDPVPYCAVVSLRDRTAARAVHDELAAAKEALASAKGELAVATAELAVATAELAAARAAQDELASAKDALSATTAELAATRAAQDELASAKDALSATTAELGAAHDSLATTTDALAAAKAELEDAHAARDELAATKDALAATTAELAATKAELEDARAARDALETATAELEDAHAARDALEAATAELEDAHAAKAELDDALAAHDELGAARDALAVAKDELAVARAAQDALVTVERRQHLLLEHAAEAYLVLDESGIVTEASATIATFAPVDEVVGADGRALVHRADRRPLVRLFADVTGRAHATGRVEVRVADAVQGVRWVEVTLSNRLDEPAICGVVVNVRDISARKRAEESMAQLSAIVESSMDSIVGITLDGRISSWNRSSAQLYGYEAAEVVGGAADLIVAGHERSRLAELLAQVGRGEHVYVPAIDAARADGSTFELSLSVSPVYDSAGDLVGASSIGRDITERRQLERDRRLAEERCRLGFERGAIGMVMFDPDGTVTRVNAALCTLLGRREKELVGANAEGFIHPDDVAGRRELLGELLAGTRNHYRAERRLLRADAEIIWALVDVTAVRDENGAVAYVFGQLQDITARKRVERALEQQALHDSLTGLPNRLALEHRLARSLEQARADGTKVAVLFVDVDNFKLVNDGLGHVVGDRVLVELAGRLAAGVRIGDTTARFGGDEFLVVCEGVADEEEARLLADRVLGLVDRPVRVDGRDIALTVSCGVAVVDGSASPEVALRGADEAMYRAKENGRARVEVFGSRPGRGAVDVPERPLVERTVVEVTAVEPGRSERDGDPGDPVSGGAPGRPVDLAGDTVADPSTDRAYAPRA